MDLVKKHPKIEENSHNTPILEVGDLIFAEWNSSDCAEGVDKIIHLFLGYCSEAHEYGRYKVFVLKSREGYEQKEGTILYTSYFWESIRYEIYHYD